MSKHTDRTGAAASSRWEDRRGDRMEAGLTRWLRSLEPAGTPISLRLRTFADLREEAARPRPRFARLRPVLSSMASLGSVVVGAGFVLLLAVVGASLDHTAGAGSLGSSLAGLGPVPQPPLDNMYGNGPDPITWMGLVGASALAGCTVVLPRVRRVASRLAFAANAAAPRAPLPLRRSWRSTSRLTWALVALAVGVSGWGWVNFLTHSSDTSLFLPSLISLGAAMVTFSLPCLVSWRYPLRDRSSRLLLIGTLASVVAVLLQLVGYIVLASWWSPGEAFVVIVWVIQAAAPIALAAGLAGRSGSVRRPPLWLASVAAGVAFFIATTFFFLDGFNWTPLAWYLADTLSGDLTKFLVLVAWMAVLWVGLSTWRRSPRSWVWALVLAAGALHVAAGVPNYLHQLDEYLNPVYVGLTGDTGGYIYNPTPYYVWEMIATAAADAALLLALLGGLRPVLSLARPDREPATHESPHPAVNSAEVASGQLPDLQSPHLADVTPSAESMPGSPGK